MHTADVLFFNIRSYFLKSVKCKCLFYQFFLFSYLVMIWMIVLSVSRIPFFASSPILRIVFFYTFFYKSVSAIELLSIFLHLKSQKPCFYS